jgi:hypothetical protein
MSEAKYKVGDEVRVPDIETPLTIVVVEPCYRFSPNGALWREEELAPYVRPLGETDRLRAVADRLAEALRRIEGSVIAADEKNPYILRTAQDALAEYRKAVAHAR